MVYTNSFQAAKVHEYTACLILKNIVGLSMEQAQQLLDTAGGLHNLAQFGLSRLQSISDIGPKRAEKILSLTQWAMLLQSATAREGMRISTPVEIANLFQLEMGLLEYEELRIVSLDTRSRIRSIDTLYRGSVNQALVRPAEIFRVPMILNCCQVILVHNHPSGDPDPSPEDVHLTRDLRGVSNSLGIDLLDHLVIGRCRYISMKERGLGF